MPWGVAAAAAGSIGSALIGSSAASSAADKQAAAANRAADMQMQQFQTTRNDLLPYNTAGQANLTALQNQYGVTRDALGTAFDKAQALSTPGTLTQAQLEAVPGYQFSLNQGLQATQANAAARGLGVSGAAMKGATNFATGLANNTYQNAFNQQQQQYANASSQFANQSTAQGQIYNQLYGPAGLGENAAAQTGAQGTQAANNAGTQIAAAGQAQAAGISASGNALAGGVNNLGGLGYLYAMQNQGGGTGSSLGAANNPNVTGANAQYGNAGGFT